MQIAAMDHRIGVPETGPEILTHLCVDCTSCMAACAPHALTIDTLSDLPKPEGGMPSVLVAPAALLDSYELERKPLAVRAAGAILQYLKETQSGALAQFTSLRSYSTGEFMALDPATRRNLELTETLRGGQTQSLRVKLPRRIVMG